ncbi:MAG: DUF4340 domain-containing protein [Myxococcales bacterium]|nr:DUF4340 domain-containing protein [Myxococcales bacterium]
MNPRTTGIAFLFAAALFAFVYFYEIRGGVGRQQAEAAARRLFPAVEAEDVEWIALTTSDGISARAERRDDAWELTEPWVFPGDEFAFDGMASALAQLSSEAIFDSPQPPEVYGLDADEREVRFGAGGEEFSLRTGDKTPVGADSYVSVGGSDAVYTVQTARINALRRGSDDLRDKRILHFDTASIEGLTATWPGGGVVLVRGDDDWRLTEPLEGPADATTVDALLSNLAYLRASGFVDDPPSDREAGLAQPDFEVDLAVRSVTEGVEPRHLRLSVGRSRDGKSRLVRAERPSLYRIAAERIADFPRDVVRYRLRQLADFAVTDATRLEIVFQPAADRPESLEPVTIMATRGEAGWTSSPERFKAGAIATLVSELSRLRADDIVAESAGPDELGALQLAPAAAVYRVYGAAPGGEAASEVKLAEVAIGAVRGDAGVLARTEGRETVFEFDYALAEHIPVSLAAFLNRFVSEESDAAEPEETAAADPDAPLAASDESP